MSLLVLFQDGVGIEGLRRESLCPVSSHGAVERVGLAVNLRRREVESLDPQLEDLFHLLIERVELPVPPKLGILRFELADTHVGFGSRVNLRAELIRSREDRRRPDGSPDRDRRLLALLLQSIPVSHGCSFSLPECNAPGGGPFVRKHSALGPVLEGAGALGCHQEGCQSVAAVAIE